MWKTIIINGNDTNYECNESGEIRNKKSKKILKGNLKKNGYLEYELYIDNIGVFVLGHRIIAQTFLINPYNFPQVNHKNGDKRDNRVENLEWCDSSYNNSHAYKNNLNSNDSIKVSIYQLDKEFNIICVYKSISEAKEKTGIANINKVLSGERQTAGGYYWQYADKNYKPRKIGTKKKVAQYSLEGKLLAVYDSASEASRITHIYRKGITDCCNGKIQSCKQYRWRFL